MRNRLWNIVAVMLMVAIAAGGWFLGVDPQLAAARTADEQRETVEAQNEATRLAITRLIADEKDLPTLQAQLVELQRSVPLDAGVSEFIDDLNNLAVASGVTVSNLTVDPAQQYVAPESAAAAAPADDPAEPADDAAAADPLAPPAVTNPLVTSANFILIPISIDTTGSYVQVVDFVSGLQNGPRLFLVNTFASASTSEEVAGEVTGSITGYIYVLLDQYDPEARAEAAEAARVEAEEAAAEIAEPPTAP